MLRRNAEHQTQLGMYLIESIDIYSDTSLHRFPFLIHFFQKNLPTQNTHTKRHVPKKTSHLPPKSIFFPHPLSKLTSHPRVTLCFKQAQGAVWWLLRSWDRSTLQRPQDIERRPPHVYDSTWFFEKKTWGLKACGACKWNIPTFTQPGPKEISFLKGAWLFSKLWQTYFSQCFGRGSCNNKNPMGKKS